MREGHACQERYINSQGKQVSRARPWIMNHTADYEDEDDDEDELNGSWRARRTVAGLKDSKGLRAHRPAIRTSLLHFGSVMIFPEGEKQGGERNEQGGGERQRTNGKGEAFVGPIVKGSEGGIG